MAAADVVELDFDSAVADVCFASIAESYYPVRSNQFPFVFVSQEKACNELTRLGIANARLGALVC